MRLLVISKTVQNRDYKSNIQNYITWNEMGKHFEQVYLIVQSSNAKFQKAHYDNLHVYWLPKIRIFSSIDYILFNCTAVILGAIICMKNKINVLNGDLSALIIKVILKKPLIVQVQGQLINLPSKTFNRFKRWYIKKSTLLICKYANRIRVVSKEIANSLELNGIQKEKIFVIPSRCDTNRFDSELFASTRDLLRKQMGFHKQSIVLIFIGRFVVSKDVSSILKAFKLIHDDYKYAELLLVGDGELKDELIQETINLNINHNVNFYGRIPYDKVPEVLACADIFLSPSIDEGMPRSVMEAQSMRIPVIVTPVGGNNEIVHHMKTGIIVSTQCPVEIYNGVKFLIESPAVSKRLGENARKLIQKDYEFKDNIKKFAEIHLINK